MPDRTYIDMHKAGLRVVPPLPPALQGKGSIAEVDGGNSRDTNIDGSRFHVLVTIPGFLALYIFGVPFLQMRREASLRPDLVRLASGILSLPALYLESGSESPASPSMTNERPDGDPLHAGNLI